MAMMKRKTYSERRVWGIQLVLIRFLKGMRVSSLGLMEGWWASGDVIWCRVYKYIFFFKAPFRRDSGRWGGLFALQPPAAEMWGYKGF